jgi:hypothetical protein
MIVKKILQSVTFLLSFDTFSQIKEERIIIGKPGISIDYSFQKVHCISIGPNFLLGIIKNKARGTHFFQIDALYTAVLLSNNNYNGFKGGSNYCFITGKGYGICAGISNLYFNKNNIVTLETGISYLGIFSINYGYSFPISKINSETYTRQKIGFRLSLNRAYALVFKMI